MSVVIILSKFDYIALHCLIIEVGGMVSECKLVINVTIESSVSIVSAT